jgi:hypothetical protein
MQLDQVFGSLDEPERTEALRLLAKQRCGVDRPHWRWASRFDYSIVGAIPESFPNSSRLGMGTLRKPGIGRWTLH